MDHVGIAKEAINIAKDVLSGLNAREVLTEKDERDYATNADIAVEKIVLAYLRQATPSYGVISEETAPNASFEYYTWVLDPIDGTINFARRHSLFGLSIALVKDREAIVFSCIFLPSLQKLYVAERRNGAKLNGLRLAVSKSSTLANSIVAFGDLATGPGFQEKKRFAVSMIVALEIIAYEFECTALQLLITVFWPRASSMPA